MVVVFVNKIKALLTQHIRSLFSFKNLNNLTLQLDTKLKDLNTSDCIHRRLRIELKKKKPILQAWRLYNLNVKQLPVLSHLTFNLSNQKGLNMTTRNFDDNSAVMCCIIQENTKFFTEKVNFFNIALTKKQLIFIFQM